MDTDILKEYLADLPLGGIRYFNKTRSTNDTALTWSGKGAPDLSLVYTEEQTAGRGRGKRSWYTFAGTGLTFSIIIKPSEEEKKRPQLFSILAALSICEVLSPLGIQGEIKWPNDVLINGKKICGILLESTWMGEIMESIVLGIGFNVGRKAVPTQEKLRFPATSLEAEMDGSNNLGMYNEFDRYSLLKNILKQILFWRNKYGLQEFKNAWQKRMAYINEQIEIWGENQEIINGTLLGFEEDGGLRLLDQAGDVHVMKIGEIHLRPLL